MWWNRQTRYLEGVVTYGRMGSSPIICTILMPNCVKVARQTLTLFVWVRILVRQPSIKSYKPLNHTDCETFCFPQKQCLSFFCPLFYVGLTSSNILYFFITLANIAKEILSKTTKEQNKQRKIICHIIKRTF